MSIETFREECRRVPELTRLWNALADIALNTQTRGLPLALLAYRGEKLSDEEHRAYHMQQQEFETAAAELARACARHDITAPALRVGEICALYS